jgi:hypothetical protein
MYLSPRLDCNGETLWDTTERPSIVQRMSSSGGEEACGKDTNCQCSLRDFVLRLTFYLLSGKQGKLPYLRKVCFDLWFMNSP